ncbi:MAG: glycosyltransferase family 9 protein [Acidobacteriota bacterium]
MSNHTASSSTQKILIVKLGSFGDIIHTIPAQQQIHRHRPDTEIHWLTEPPYAELLGQIPGLKRVWPADTKKWRKQLSSLTESFPLIRSLRRQRFDLALDFQGLVKSAVLARLSGAREVVGFTREQAREPASSYFYSTTLSRDMSTQPHAIDINLDLTRCLDFSSDGASPLIPLEIPEEAVRYVDRQLELAGITNPVLINPGAGWITKRWPAQNYGRLLLELKQQLNLSSVVTYGPGEEELLEQMVAAAGSLPVNAFPTDFFQLAALCRRSRLMVAGDTGPLHLAVALGTPTVAVIGPTTPWRNGPFNPNDVVVKRDLPCSDSYKRTCDHFICMDIPVSDVFKAVVRRLKP